MDRRTALRGLTLSAGLALGGGLLLPGGGGARAAAPACPDDRTPNQFTPKAPPDPTPLEGELEKYPRCPYCGMSRVEHHAARHLIHYADDRVDGVCSLRCASLSLALNIDRGPKAIYAADYGAATTPRPLVPVEGVLYLIGSGLPGIMTTRSKHPFADRSAAEAARERHGGELGGFDAALTATYLDLARDTAAIRQRREERRRRSGHGQ